MNRRALIIMVLLAMVFSLSWAAEVIRFECPNLEERIRKAEGYSGNKTGPIYPADLLEIEKLEVSDAGIASLEGIQHFTNLQELYFFSNSVSDLTPIKNLTSLRKLDFWYNRVSDLTPLHNLTNLQELYFGGNEVSNLTPLQNLTNLEWLYFEDNLVSDISSLVSNPGLVSGVNVDLRWNNLNLVEGSQNMNDIHTLIGRGIKVRYEPQN